MDSVFHFYSERREGMMNMYNTDLLLISMRIYAVDFIQVDYFV